MRINEITRRGFLKGIGATAALPMMPKIPSLPIDPVNIEKLMYKGTMVFDEIIKNLTLPDQINSKGAIELFKNNLIDRLEHNVSSDLIKLKPSRDEIEIAVKKLLAGDLIRNAEERVDRELKPWQEEILQAEGNSRLEFKFKYEPVIFDRDTLPMWPTSDIRNIRQLVSRQNSIYNYTSRAYVDRTYFEKKDGTRMTNWDDERGSAEAYLLHNINKTNRLPTAAEIDAVASQQILNKYQRKYSGDLLFKAIKRRYGKHTNIIIDNIMKYLVKKYGQEASKMITDLFGDEIKQIKDLKTDIVQLPAPTQDLDKEIK